MLLVDNSKALGHAIDTLLTYGMAIAQLVTIIPLLLLLGAGVVALLVAVLPWPGKGTF